MWLGANESGGRPDFKYAPLVQVENGLPATTNDIDLARHLVAPEISNAVPAAATLKPIALHGRLGAFGGSTEWDRSCEVATPLALPIGASSN